MGRGRPTCIGIILDGNRRWAKERGLPSFEGHRIGFERLTECVRWVKVREVPHLVVYAFSTENWNRSRKEVSYLMDLFRGFVRSKLKQLADEGVRVRFIGEREMLPSDMPELFDQTEREGAANTKLTMWVALSYGARQEIVAAASALAAAEEAPTEERLRGRFWSAEMPDPDIIIRTGGEKRLSNFLLWQAAYSELFFLDAYWPDFSEQMLDEVLAEYAGRERRMGR